MQTTAGSDARRARRTSKMSKRLGFAALLALLASLVLPGMAFAQGDAVDPVALDLELDNLWIMVACALVFLMQAGFLLLEIGFSRQKNAGTGVAKVLLNLAVITIAWWAIGYGINSASGNDILGTDGFFFHFDQVIGAGEDAFAVAA